MKRVIGKLDGIYNPALPLGDDVEHFVAGIESQEKIGQDRLPVEIQPPVTHEMLAAKLGFQYGEVVDGVFLKVQLPEGWKIEPTEHAMWSRLRDAKGRDRASIFFKAAFYDYHAHMCVWPRFHVDAEYEHEAGCCGKRRYRVNDRNDGKLLFVTEFSEGFAGQRECDMWLRQNFPQYGDEFAYWDTE